MKKAYGWQKVSMSTLIRKEAIAEKKLLASRAKIALVHERLNVMAGSDKVLCTMHEMYPDAPIFTALSDKKLVDAYLPGTDIRTSFLQKLPLVAKHHQKFLPLYMLAFEQFDLSDFDLVISSCHCAAKAVITKPNTCHICYCYSPMRYAWDLQHQYMRFQGWAVRNVWSAMANYVRVWDLATSHRVDYFIAISSYIARRIKKFYGRPSAIIYPPVDIERFRISPSIDDYYLVVSRFAPYKRVDLIVKAFNELGWRLVVIGDGEQEAYLRKIAKPNIEFKGFVSDEEVVDYYAHCKALVHAAEEDFGINMVETLAAGRPVVAYSVGGAADIVSPGINGVLFHEPDAGSLIAALTECEHLVWNPEEIQQTSTRFSKEKFQRDFASFVEWALDDFAHEEGSLWRVERSTL